MAAGPSSSATAGVIIPPTLQSRPPASDDELALRCVLDTSARTSTGIFIYPAVWLSLALATGWSERWPGFIWGNVAGLIAMAMLRTAYNWRLPVLLKQQRVRAERLFYGMTLSTALYWGCLTAACLHLAPRDSMSWIMLSATIGFCAGANTMFGINPTLRIRYPMLMIAPVFAIEVFHPTLENLAMAFLQVIFALYLIKASRLVHDDYWAARQAQRQADLHARELELASLTDGLTGLPNRMHFDRQFSYEWARHCRHGGQISILIVDLDHFKNINDTHGHPFGDTCLQAVSRALQAGCHRSTDLVARYGGEEFVALLVETDREGALLVARHMLTHVRALTLSHAGQPVRITCSIGVATVAPSREGAADDLIIRADNALYAAKHAGRDQAAVAPD